MERAASKGEIDEAELRALEEDMTGRVWLGLLMSWMISNLCAAFQIMLASWRGTRFEVVNVLREVISIRML